MATLAGNALASPVPLGLKAVNLILHLITGSLVWLFVRVLARS